ncbi:MAG: DUF5034 domain-containing protein, partial [Clostridia bacterium]|nr:DUF5034 domain-containing protein [Clostridia bacterium]
ALAITCIVLSVIVFALFGFGVYVLLEATNYCHNLATDFWVTVDGNRYYVDSDGLVLFDTDVQVHYLVDWLSGKKGYSCKIVPAGENFGYLVDGQIYEYWDIEDLSSAFEIVEQDKSFTINAKGKKVADVLQALYPNSKVITPTEFEGDFHYKLVITSVDGKTVSLTFRCAIGADSIEIDPPAIIF